MPLGHGSPVSPKRFYLPGTQLPAIDANVTAGQGGQSVAASSGLTAGSTATTAQGGQSVSASSGLTANAIMSAAQGSQSIAATGGLTANATGTSAQGSQSIAAAGDLPLAATLDTAQDSQSLTTSSAPDVATGGGGGAPKTRRIVVEVDGQMHEVRSKAEAVDLLQSVRAQVERTAQHKVAVAKSIGVKPLPPTVTVNPDAFREFQGLRAEWARQLKAIDQAFALGVAAYEAEQDDEDAIMVLLH